MAYNVSNDYKQVIYSGNSNNKLKLLFNNVELQNADLYCEKVTIKSRIIPNGAKRFSLNNFISKEAEVILHDIDTSIIQDQISISIGTLVGNAYEYVPIGIFNIQDTPTTDKNKTTIKLRDNSVKFDFNYNAKPLIDEEGGSATKLQILQDICTKANVTCNISSFIGSTDSVGIYDNTITARQYIADIAEQAGRIATINRSGELIFVNLNSLTTWDIPLSIVEKYEVGTPYKIGRVVYEDAIRKYETASTNYDTLYLDSSNPYVSSQEQVNNILQQVNNFAIDSVKTGKILGNPAIDSYDLIQIHDKSINLLKYPYYATLPTTQAGVTWNDNKGKIIASGTATGYSGFTLESNLPVQANTNYRFYIVGTQTNVTIDITGSGLGINIPTTSLNNNGYIFNTGNATAITINVKRQTNSLVEANFYPMLVIGTNVSVDYKPYYDNTYTTLATNDLVYNGVLTNTFDTQIGEEERKENVSIVGEATFKKWATTNINNINGEIDIQAGKIDNVEKEINPTKDLSGTSFHLTDSTDAKLVNFELEGKTTQETRSGKNLLYVSPEIRTSGDLTITKNEDGSITLNGMASSYSYCNINTNYSDSNKNKYFALENGKSYTLYVYGDMANINCVVRTTTQTAQLIKTGTGGNIGTISYSGTTDTQAFAYLGIASNVQFNNVIIKPMLVEGIYTTQTIGEFEQYGKKPAPDLPSELVSVGYQNLLNFDDYLTISNATYTKENNVYSISALGSAYSTPYTLNLKPNTTYTISQKYHSQTPTNVRLEIFEDSTIIGRSYATDSSSLVYTFTTNANSTYKIRINYSSGSLPIYFDSVIIVEHSQARSYIPYGKYGIEVKTIGKNLFNYGIKEETLYDLKLTSNNSEMIFDGTKTSSSNTIAKTSIGFLKAGRYTFSYSKKSGSYTNISDEFTLYAGTTKVVIISLNRDTYTNSFTINNDTEMFIQYWVNSGSSYSNYDVLFQLEKGDATDYEAYKKETYLYTLNQPLRSIDNVKDKLYIKNSYLYVERNIGSKILNGSESWGTIGNNRYWVAFPDKRGLTSAVPCLLKSNYFTATANANDTVNIGEMTEGYYTIANYNVFFNYNGSNSDLAGFKTWLSTHNTEVQYVLETPVVEELGDIEVPSTYKPITNIDTTDNLEPNMNITYVRDTQITNYVEEHISQIIVNEEGITQRVQTIEDSDYDSKINAIELHQTSTDYTINAISQNVTFTEFDEEGNPINSNINSVTTTTGFTFNEDGLNIKKSDTDYNTLIDNTGTYYKDGETIISMTNKDGFLAKDFRLQGQHYYSYNANNSSEPLASENYDFVDERIEIEVDGQTQYAYATFYNGEV